jgi:hypothetical protein
VEKAFDLVPRLADVVTQLRIDLVTALDLRLEIFDRAVNIADRSEVRAAFGIVVFELFLEL